MERVRRENGYFCVFKGLFDYFVVFDQFISANEVLLWQ